MAATPGDVRVRLTSEGVADVVKALRTVRAEAELLSRSSTSTFGKIGASVASALNPINALKTALPALGLAAVAAGFLAVTKNITQFEELAGLAAERINTTAESFSALAFHAKQAEISAEQLETGLGILTKNVSGLKSGSSAAADSLAELGLSASDFAGKDTAQAAELVAQRLFKVANGGDRARLVMDIFGKSGRQLLPVLRQLAEQGLAAVTAEADAFGQVVTGKASAASNLFNDNLDKLTGTIKGSARQLVDSMLPALNEITNKMVEAAKRGGALDAIFAGLEASAKVIFKGSDVAQAKAAEAEAQAALDRTKKLLESGQLKVPFLPFIDIKLNDKALADLKTTLAKQETVLANARTRVAELTKPPEKPKDGTGGDGDLEAFDAAKRVAELTKTLRLDELKSSEAAAVRQREIAVAQIKSEQDLLAARQSGAASQQEIDRAAIASISARTALEKQALADGLASIDLRQRAIAQAVQKEILALAASGEPTKRQQAVLVELNKQSLDQRLAVTQTHYQRLLALQAEYVAKYKASSDAIKSIDKEVADNRRALTAINTQEDLSGLSEAEKIGALRRKGVELEAQQFRAAAAGNVEDTRRLKDELLEVNKALRDLGAFKLGAEFGESGVRTLEKLLEKQRVAEQNNNALAKQGIAGVGEQLEKTGSQIQTFFKERLGTIDLKFGADQAALTSLVDSIRDQLGKEVFRVNVAANVSGPSAPAFARGGVIPGPISPGGDDIIAAMKRGEGVLTVRAVQHFGGRAFVDAINQLQLPRFAAGGVVGSAGVASGAAAGEVHHVDITMNRKSLGRVSGSREAVRNLVDMLNEVSRGT